MHSAIDMARFKTASRLRAELLWPYDCERRCNEQVPVSRGPWVADELTRRLREPYKTMMREQY